MDRTAGYPVHRPDRRVRGARGWRVAALAGVVLAAGCATSSSKWVALRSTPKNPLTESLGLLTRQGPQPTPRTKQLLRRYDLDAQSADRGVLLARLDQINDVEPSREHLYSLAELAYIGAERSARSQKHPDALEMYGAAVLYAYEYLLDDRYAADNNPYDPQFRRACDLYNAALEGMLRSLQRQHPLRPGEVRELRTAGQTCRLRVELLSEGWRAEDFQRVEFVSDYEVHGLRNHYHNFGLGVPLIGVRGQRPAADAREKFYPPQLSFPLTAFLRIPPADAASGAVELASAEEAAGPPSAGVKEIVLELHDPLARSTIDVAGLRVPLETDLSTPLAHTLSQAALDDGKLSTLGLLKPEKVKQLSGLYMLEPFHPGKIPVLMVHGLWSSPVTWMEMFNDLRSDPFIRQHYQFWFYLYPTGQPFWFSAAQMRRDLTAMRTALDPQRSMAPLDRMVLVGHSMGGLVSKLQTVESGNAFWSTMSERSFAELQADPDMRDDLADTFFFAPNASIQRVVTIGTPHRGSEFSNDVTQWLGRKLIRIPTQMLLGRNQLASLNPGYFRPNAPLEITTSIDSLSPKSPVLPVLLEAPAGGWVRYHNIVGDAPEQPVANRVSQWLTGKGDGVVSLDSARLAGADSELVVSADHSSVHRHPQSVLEVRRILRDHLRAVAPPIVHAAGLPAAPEPAVR